MKSILLSLLLIASTSAISQVDSSKVSQTVTLSQDQHTFLIAFIGDITAPKINYINQVRAAYDSTNPAKNITVTVPSGLIVEVYQSMTSQAEGVTSDYNNTIKAALLPQITSAWLGRQLQAIIDDNIARRTLIMQKSKDFILSIN